MFFTDTAFYFFLPIVVFIFWLMPAQSAGFFSRAKAGKLILLVASYLFYGWAIPWIAALMLSVTLANYYFSLLIEKHENQKKFYLILDLAVCLGLLVYFKYAIFILENLSLLFPGFSYIPEILLPAGISFYTFQSIGYTIDVYKKRIPAEKDFVNLCLFIAFFPQLVAGPIERTENLLRQIKTDKKFQISYIFDGIDLLLRGYIKKIVIADNIALYVNMIFDLKNPSTNLILMGVFGFSVQILADFSAYTDIARGCGKMLGFDLMENFKNPYLSKSPSDFWKRWHISLSQFIRDYLYIPLGGSEVSNLRWVLNIAIVWFICGLWHGASWNFVLWGLYWGMLLIVFRYSPSLPENALFNLFRVLRMYVLVFAGWLLFRVRELNLISGYFSLDSWNAGFRFNQQRVMLVLCCITGVYAFMMVCLLLISKFTEFAYKRSNFKIPLRIIGYTLGIVILCIFRSADPADFIYFQF